MAFYEIEDEELEELRKQSEIPVPKDGYPLYRETWGTSVILGGNERKSFSIINCKVHHSELFRYGEWRGSGRTWEEWIESRNGYLYPINEKKMAMAIIVEDDDLNNLSQSEPCEYLLLWSPPKKAWIRPNRKYREILNNHIL